MQPMFVTYNYVANLKCCFVNACQWIVIQLYVTKACSWGQIMKAAEKKAVGRPRKYATRRPTWTIRLEDSLAERVRAIAEQDGKSFSEVCEGLIGSALNELTKLRRDAARLEEELYQTRADWRKTQGELGAYKDSMAGRPSFEATIGDIVERAVKRALKRSKS
jgi:hypothetical protein